MQLYSATQVRELDRRAIAELGIPGYTLMQRAARASFDALRAHWPHAGRIAVFCGPGNNGGDGYEIARLAQAAGMRVDLVQVGSLPATGDAVTARAAWLDDGGEFSLGTGASVRDRLAGADVICDAIFGIGITREVTGAAREAIEAINARAAAQRVLAVDLPSGLDADTGAVHGAAVRADLSLSFIGRKLGAYTAEGPDYCGEREHADLDLPADFLASAQGVADLLDSAELSGALPMRLRSAHKGRHGHVLIVGGDQGMAGAVLLAARGALRAGAGLVSVATRTVHAPMLSMAQAEVMARAVETPAELDELIARCSVIAVGPGLGQGAWARALFARVVESGKALVIDADALNLLAESPRALPPSCILTPHPAEAARLLGKTTSEIQADRVAAIDAVAARYGATVVLKGAGSLVRDRSLALCPYGNPGMGVGGSGDVLTGVIAALVAQGLAGEAAARMGVLAHALAGDRAATQGERGMLPSDLIDALRGVVNPTC